MTAGVGIFFYGLVNYVWDGTGTICFPYVTSKEGYNYGR